jgi:histidinol-phosphate aminotransferase
MPNSRRSFLRLAGLATASLPILTEAHFARAAAPRTTPDSYDSPSGKILINANENPLGPCPAALAAMSKLAPTGGRYDLYDETPNLIATFAKQNNIPASFVSVYPGSSEPLHYAVLAFTSPTRSLVTADPTYEAAYFAAAMTKAPVVKVPLLPNYAHDLRAMVASPNAGVIYICNPNNPTGTLTPREEIEYALAHKPKGSILLVDEAYIHLSSATSVVDLAGKGEDLIVLRTFSKIYGMAGIRCGLAIGRPDLLAKLQAYFGWGSMCILGSGAANASLLDPTLVPTRKKLIADTRNQTFDFLRAHNYKFIPSESNCFMIDTGRPGKKIIDAMAAQNVLIGRAWPIWPTMVRVSVGTPAEMARFQTAFHQVMSNPIA